MSLSVVVFLLASNHSSTQYNDRAKQVSFDSDFPMGQTIR